MSCHHKLEADLHGYIEALHAAAKKHGAAVDPKAWLFRTTEGQSGALTGRTITRVPGPQASMIAATTRCRSMKWEGL